MTSTLTSTTRSSPPWLLWHSDYFIGMFFQSWMSIYYCQIVMVQLITNKTSLKDQRLIISWLSYTMLVNEDRFLTWRLSSGWKCNPSSMLQSSSMSHSSPCNMVVDKSSSQRQVRRQIIGLPRWLASLLSCASSPLTCWVECTIWQTCMSSYLPSALLSYT